jgi:hypothetical protein
MGTGVAKEQLERVANPGAALDPGGGTELAADPVDVSATAAVLPLV